MRSPLPQAVYVRTAQTQRPSQNSKIYPPGSWGLCVGGLAGGFLLLCNSKLWSHVTTKIWGILFWEVQIQSGDASRHTQLRLFLSCFWLPWVSIPLVAFRLLSTCPHNRRTLTKIKGTLNKDRQPSMYSNLSSISHSILFALFRNALTFATTRQGVSKVITAVSIAPIMRKNWERQKKR